VYLVSYVFLLVACFVLGILVSIGWFCVGGDGISAYVFDGLC